MAPPDDNPLLAPASPLPFDRIEAVHVAPALDGLVGHIEERLDRLPESASYEASLGALEPARAAHDAVVRTTHVLDALATSRAWRAARTAADAATTTHARTVAQHPRLNATLEELARQDLTPLQRQHVRRLARRHRRLGARLDPQGRLALRRTLDALADETAAAAAEPARADLRAILRLRQQWARQVGFSSFIAMQLQGRMATSPSAVEAFLATERARLRRTLAEDAPTDPPEGIGDYLSLGGVVSGMFELVQRLFGVTAVRADAPAWHPSVATWRLFDGEAAFGWLYADLRRRPGKRSGAWTHGLRTTPPGPSAAVICAGIDADDDTAPLRASDVAVLFHELGHALHHVLSRVPVADLAGVAVAHDFVEYPSQVMERLCFHPRALDRFARHVDTGRPLPAPTLAALVRAWTGQRRRRELHRVAVAQVDRTLHDAPDLDGPDFDPLSIAANILHEPDTPRPDRAATLATLMPLVSEPAGSAGGAYTYPWGARLAAATVARLHRGGGQDVAVGRALRREVLARGASRPPEVLLAALSADGP